MSSDLFTPWLAVAALALYDAHGHLLLQQRTSGKRYAGLWEFPGGKVEVNETPRAALMRELEEELGIVLDPDNLAPMLLAEESGDPPIVLLLYRGYHWRGELVARERQAWGWHSLDQACARSLAPMDRTLIERLRHIAFGSG